MKKLIFVAVGVLALSLQALAKSPIEVTDARIFAPMKGSNATAGYAVIKNISQKSVTLVLKKAEPFQAAELHETIEKDGRMSMQRIEKLVIEAHHGFELKPGGNHIMLFDANKAVNENDVIHVQFDIDGHPETVDFKVILRNKN